MKKLLIDQANLLEVVDMIDSANGELVSDATVTATVESADGETIITASAITFVYTSSNKDKRPAYQGYLSKTDAANLVEGEQYYVWFDADGGATRWRCLAIAGHHC